MEDLNLEALVVELTEFIRNRHFGKYRGIVQNVDDPENLGRIIVRVPEVYGDEDSPWALPSVPFAGDSHGLVLLPETGDGVWVEFEAGDPSRPIWTGCWWGSGEMPASGTSASRVLVTTGGHKLILDDENGKVQIVHSGGPQITLTGDSITIEIGGTEMVLSASGVNVNSGALEVR